MDDKGRIAVLMGGDSSEREISLQSGDAVVNALRSLGYGAEAVDISTGLGRLVTGGFKLAFVALHGQKGEDGCIQGLLELLGIPYTSSGVLASAATMDKVFSKGVMVSEGISTPDYEVFDFAVEPDKEIATCLDFPVIVKPSSEGSTIGIKKAGNASELKVAVKEAASFDSKVLVERFISGREVTVSLLDGEVYPVVEVLPKNGFYDYEAKYTKGMTEYRVPAELEEETRMQVTQLAEKVYTLFGCKGAARVDLMLGSDGPTVLEINTVPGMTETSLLPKAAAAAGIDFEALVGKMIEGASLEDRSRSERLIQAFGGEKALSRGMGC